MTQACTISESSQLLFTLLYDSLLSLIFFLYTHPLQLAYLLYFSPYILKLFSFLFPLLLSTSIILLLFSLSSIIEVKPASIVAASIGNVFEWEFEEMGELYKINMDPISEVKEEEEEEDPTQQLSLKNSENHNEVDSGEEPTELSTEKSIGSECNFVPQTPDRIPETLRAKQTESKIELSRSQSEKGNANYRLLHESSLSKCSSFQNESKEKEWRRTLAYKIYEERRASEGAEDMDLLWEAYETSAADHKVNKNREKKSAKKKSSIEEEEEEEDESVGVQFCCLQALKLSTSKMNLGVAKPIATKISKVFKGTGLFRGSSSRRSKNKVES